MTDSRRSKRAEDPPDRISRDLGEVARLVRYYRDRHLEALALSRTGEVAVGAAGAHWDTASLPVVDAVDTGEKGLAEGADSRVVVAGSLVEVVAGSTRRWGAAAVASGEDNRLLVVAGVP